MEDIAVVNSIYAAQNIAAKSIDAAQNIAAKSIDAAQNIAAKSRPAPFKTISLTSPIWSHKSFRSGTSFAKTNAKAVPSLPLGGRTNRSAPAHLLRKQMQKLCRRCHSAVAQKARGLAKKARHALARVAAPSFLGTLLRRWRRPSKEAAKPHHFIITSQPQGRTQPTGNAQPTAQPEKGGDEQTPSAASFVGC